MVRTIGRFSILSLMAVVGTVAGLAAALFLGNIITAQGMNTGAPASATTIVIEQ